MADGIHAGHRTDETVVADCDRSRIQKDTVIIDKDAFSNMNIKAEVTLERRFEAKFLSDGTEKLLR